MLKKKLFIGVSLAGLLLVAPPQMNQLHRPSLPQVVYAETVESIDNYRSGTVTKAEITLEGYITGALASNGQAYDLTNSTNLALASKPGVPASETVPVQLPKTDVRTNFNLVEHPDLIGKKVRITGTSDTYMKRNGIKGTTKIEILESTTPDTNPPATPKTITPISTVRQSPKDQTYTIVGKIISPVDAWGGQGFYVQDTSGVGLYIYPQKIPLGYRTGDVVQLTGKLAEFKGDLQLTEITEHSKVNSDIETGVTDTTISNLSTAPAGTLLKLSNVIVGAIDSDSFGTSTFTVKDSAGQLVDVRLDNRTGIKNDQLLTQIDKGDEIHLTGILSYYNGKAQIKPFALEHFEVLKRAPRVEPDTQAVKIGEVQGASHISPLLNQAVTLKDVVVTYITSKSHFYVQDLEPDNNEATSDGIQVYLNNADVKVGDVLTLSGTVEERFGYGYDEREETDLSITQLKAKSIKKTGTEKVPAPIVLGKDRTAPQNIIDNDGMKIFDPQEDALDFWESLEGMLVAVEDAKVVGPLAKKEIYVLPGNSSTHLNNVGGVSLRPDGYNTELVPVLLKDGKQTIKSGDYFKGQLVGPVTYSYTNYKVYVDDATLPQLVDGQLLPEKTNLVKDENKLSIASYNIENFSADKSSTTDEKVERIARSFVSDLNSPDIIGLIEVQDNNGAKDDGTTDATQSAQRLIEAIKKLGGPDYTYIDIAPENNMDGGQKGANIRTGFLYNRDRVELSNKSKGTATETVVWQNGELNFSIGRIEPTAPVWTGVRKPLAAEFVFKGSKVVVVANHLNSKRGDNGLYGRVQPVVFKSEQTRHQLAQILSQFSQTGLSQNPNANIVMLGDFNDYEFTKTIQIIEGGGMANLVSRHTLEDRFSYFYQGNNQSLDNMLLSTNLLDKYEFDMVHVNSPFMVQHGRASDHDPLLVQLTLASEKTPVPPTTTQVTTTTVAPTSQPMTTMETPTTQTTVTTEVSTTQPTTQTTVTSLPSATTQTKTKKGNSKTVLPKTNSSTNYIYTVIGVVMLAGCVLTLKNKKDFTK